MPWPAPTETTAQLADRVCSIGQALALGGNSVELAGVRSVKTWCPTGDLYHPDGARAMRVYPDSNSAWCFAGCGWFGPVRYLSAALSIEPDDAATRLLEVSGYTAPARTWDEVTSEVIARPDTAALAAALTVWAADAIPGWQRLQFDQELSQLLTGCMGLLTGINTAAAADLWLERSKYVLLEWVRTRAVSRAVPA